MQSSPRTSKFLQSKSARCFWFKRSFAMPTSKTAKAVFGTAVATCHPEQVRNVVVLATYGDLFPHASKFCGRNGVDGAKPPQAGSHKSLMYLSVTKELFYHKGCKFTFQGVDQTLRRPLAVLLFEIAVKGTAYPKTTGNFKKQNFDSAGFSHCNLRYNIIPRLLRSG